MDTLTIEIDNPTLLEHLKSILGSIKGVKIISSKKAKSSTNEMEDIPNQETLAAMKEVEQGKDAGIVKLDNIDQFIASMQ
ncbi:MAG: hypothetical protein PUF37_01925 [Prevotellaceae bacterium]|nr:hypothetical protein [Prevotella sp.]MDD6552331.1 hypothetical protein [Prevotellaceae bacterium]